MWDLIETLKKQIGHFIDIKRGKIGDVCTFKKNQEKGLLDDLKMNR